MPASPATPPTAQIAQTTQTAQTAQTAPSVEVEAVRSLARVARLLERASGELGLAHYRVLSAIAAGEGRASRVARRFELGRPTISAAVDALSRAELIERSVAKTDQRAFDLALTRKGQDVLDAVEAEMVAVLEDLCGRLASSAGATATLAALVDALDARAEDGHGPSSTRPRRGRALPQPGARRQPSRSGRDVD